ncbi:DNA-directed RNA polymerase subunit alpha [Candidatus Phytoplasma pini]|uniref:DNA-directed RNA polymerase subunit alpha n=1 Tax=Candidatus Phytoplasma pini TaxID=267362 RepID=A0A559KJM5_9MOLU|nr:DNA-directed RNA polymerase subunit alpha [Candidatus Phytoplasma pini]TVY12334.1 DNA-directed RNA polymerase subunit alpha [Candidatus Phytoplasma pini]
MDKLKFIKPIMEIEETKTDLFNKKFIIQRLERGFGLTLGNSLRRVLLSSLPGSAIVNVYIEGIEYEFSVIPGIYEDVMSIILNLKKVIISVDSLDDNFEQKIEIDVKGERVVTAADFKTIDNLKIVNPDQVIAHLSDEKSSLKLQATVRRGIGYVSAEENKIYGQNKFGVIAIDSLYTPTTRVTYNVEQKLNNKEELFLEIETNKSISSKEALSIAAKILVNHLNILVDLCDKAKETEFIYEPEIKNHNHALDLRIDQLEISVRLFNSLKKSGINTIKELISKNEKEIMNLNSLGKKSFEELKNKITELDLCFKNTNID